MGACPRLSWWLSRTIAKLQSIALSNRFNSRRGAKTWLWSSVSGRRARGAQNFLTRKGFLSKLLDLCAFTPRDLVVEVGAGRGHVTRLLARRCRSLIAYEIDERLIRSLTDRTAEFPNVEIRRADFLASVPPRAEYRVFSNLPFNITADAVAKLTSDPHPPADAHLIVQREAAARFTGGPFGKECLVSLLLKPWWSLEVLAEVPRTVFSPEPRVEAVLLRVKRRKQSLISRSDRERFEDFIAFAYSGPGPTLRDNLSAVLRRAQFNRLTKSFGLHVRATPGQVTFEQWCGLFEFFSRAVSGSGRRVVEGSARAPRRRRFGVVGGSRKK